MHLMRRARVVFDRWTAWSPVLLLGALAGLTFWLDAQVQSIDTARPGDARHDPDIFITNFRAVSFDASGRVKQSLTAQRAQHHPDDESVEFVSPQLILTDPTRPKLTVRSDAGTLSGDRETMLFRGHVHAVRETLPDQPAGSDANGPLTLTTDVLRVLPNKGVAETDRPVTIEEPRGIIHGVGIVLDNQMRTMKVKSGVRGSFQPESPK
ncbi:MAG TPA: LPS export ABC transporter periplasmic protein LptC [Casimicrobiaceae bacterium]|nr:LPS export ABC transporter periplasmic protein LptC [Casimicrobiaceae bacterium]